MSTGEGREGIQEGAEPSEAELRAAYEQQVKKLRVEHVVLEDVVTLANLGMRRTGLAPGTEEERDADQVRMAIEAIRALLPVIEQTAPAQVGPIRDALSQLQLAYVRIGGQEPARAEARTGQEPARAGAGTGQEAARAGAGTGQEAPGSPGPPPPDQPPGGAKREEPGPAQRSGRLWVPGQ